MPKVPAVKGLSLSAPNSSFTDSGTLTIKGSQIKKNLG